MEGPVSSVLWDRSQYCTTYGTRGAPGGGTAHPSTEEATSSPRIVHPSSLNPPPLPRFALHEVTNQIVL